MSLAGELRSKLGQQAQRVWEYYRYHLELLRGERSPLSPPPYLHPVGHGDFERIGTTFLQYFIELGDLRPEHRVLDVGCGIGRIAVPLTRFLRTGSYEGFDITRAGIKWCQTKITPRYPNFKFTIADIYNKVYNPKGRKRAEEYQFPYPDNEFDFTFLTSVFTHMFPHDMNGYLAEITRTLKTGGKCFISYFLLNAESLALVQEGRCSMPFIHQLQGCRTTNLKAPEAAIAFDESAVRELYRQYGLRIVEPVHYGSWCERKNMLSYQDIIVAIKT